MTSRYKMVLAYDGTGYSGWQIQPVNRTIQGELERVLAELTGERPRVHCSGRTDAGVHARGQVAHFDLERKLVPAKLQEGMNALLDSDIRVTTMRRARADFHARLSAKGKEYRYFIWNAEVLDPSVRLYRCHLRQPLDLKAMQQAANQLEGRHDFLAFSANPNREQGETVRTLERLAVSKRGADLTIVARGEGFLYKMVRSLAGFLIRVGEGAEDPKTAPAILHTRRRTARVPTAPPQGLFLWKVYY